MDRIFKIAVTGSAGSGKSLVGRRFSELGLPLIDCDVLAREAAAPGMPAFDKIVNLFGEGVVAGGGGLDRKKLRNLITQDPKLRQHMENAIHPEILTLLSTRIKELAEKNERAVVVEIPLLFELGLEKRFDYTVTVAGCRSDMVKRIQKRDHVTAEAAERMLDMQKTQQEKIEKADAVLWNTAGKTELLKEVDSLYQKIAKEYLT